MTILLLHFQFGFFSFLFPLWLPWLRFPKLCWIKVARVDILVTFLILKEYFKFFTIENDIIHGLIIYGLYYVEVDSFCPLPKEFLITNRCWILLNTCSTSIEMIIWFLFFSLLMWITLINLWILKNPCTEINPTLSQCMILFMYYWI